MAPRATWKGFIKLSLVSVPVKAYTAHSSEAGEVRLNQLHNECHSRIKYKKSCPIHGDIPNDEIVSGYEYAKDQYVVIDTEEISKLRTEDDKAINIREFILPDALDPLYYSDKTYYLVPDGPVGQRPYGVLHKGLVEQDRFGIATVVMHGKEQTVVLRPIDNLLTMTPLVYEDKVTKPSTFEDEVVKVDASADEVKLIKMLIDASTAKQFDFSKYKDIYQEKLTELIQAKVEGRELVAAPAQEHAHVINLMDALKQSVQNLQVQEEAPKPEKKTAPSKKTGEGAKKKKSS